MLGAGLGVVLLADAVLRVARAALVGWAGMRFEHETGRLSIDAILRTPLSHIEGEGAGVHLDRLTAIDRLRDFYTGPGISVLVDLPFVVFFLPLIALIGGERVFVTLVLFALFAVSAAVVGRILRGALERRAQVDDHRVSFIVELFRGIHTVKAMAMEAQMMRRYERLLRSASETSYATINAAMASQSAGTVFSHLTMVSVVAYGSTQVLAGELTIGGLAACTLLAGRTITPMLRPMDIWTHFQNLRVARGRLDALLRAPKEATEQLPAIGQVAGRLALQGMHFTHPGGASALFKGVDLDIAPGEAVALAGGNGSGKSTLLHLMRVWRGRTEAACCWMDRTYRPTRRGACAAASPTCRNMARSSGARSWKT